MRLPVRPVRGQIITVQAPPGTLGPVVACGEHYALSRRDGLVLLGSTLEDVGFRNEVTAAGREAIAGAVLDFLPGLRTFPSGPAWSGLRPATPDGLPLLGWHDALDDRLLVATGHFRSGILLAPATAAAGAALIDGREPPADLSTLDPTRFAESTAHP